MAKLNSFYEMQIPDLENTSGVNLVTFLIEQMRETGLNDLADSIERTFNEPVEERVLLCEGEQGNVVVNTRRPVSEWEKIEITAEAMSNMIHNMLENYTVLRKTVGRDPSIEESLHAGVRTLELLKFWLKSHVLYGNN